ncbi:MAG TPA: ABC transporter permease [Candidatus Blautia faecipullorum]|nr:ABC transporter permease [Candidatus Blautia faecipullorum]
MIQSVKMAWHAVTVNKLRTFLTMLGIIIGVAALIVLVSIAGGAASSVTEEISGMGSSFLTVTVNDDKENPLRLGELSDFAQPEEIEAVAPVSRTSVTAKSGYTSGTMTLTGTTGSYALIQDFQMESGRFLKNADIENSSYVVVLTPDTAVELLGRRDVAGESISLGGRSFLVIGVLDEESASSLTGNMGSVAVSTDDGDSETSVSLEGYIPFSTMTRIADNILDVTQFYASAASEDTLDYAERELDALLMERFENDEDAFTVTDQSEIMEAMENVDNTMSLMLGGIAAISLLVGGIGIMNIMLVSVTERTREIGIRKAIGAKKRMILLQFLIEALLVSIMGCIVGIGLSWAILRTADLFIDSMSFEMDMGVAALAMGFSALIGILFGLYPANKAAGKKPIEALRHSA